MGSGGYARGLYRQLHYDNGHLARRRKELGISHDITEAREGNTPDSHDQSCNAGGPETRAV